MSGADSTAKLTDALIDRLDRMLEILGRIASAAEARRVVVAGGDAPTKPRDHREALLYEMMREENSLGWADKQAELNTDGLRKGIKQRVLILWFASKLWYYVETDVNMYTQLFDACHAYTPKSEVLVSEQSFNQFKAGIITSELTSWAKFHCRECFEPPDVPLPTMISEFYKNMKAGDAPTETYSPQKTSVLRNELMLAMNHEKTPLQHADKQKVHILWFASKLWDSVETNVEMYTRLFHACNAYTPKREIRVSEQSFNEFKAGNITSELTSWAKSHCRECFREPLDVSLPTMISEFYKNMGRGPPPTA